MSLEVMANFSAVWIFLSGWALGACLGYALAQWQFLKDGEGKP